MLSFILLCMSCLVFIPSIYILCNNTTFEGRYLLIATLLLQTIVACWSDITTSYYREIDRPGHICDLLCIYLFTTGYHIHVSPPALLYVFSFMFE